MNLSAGYLTYYSFVGKENVKCNVQLNAAIILQQIYEYFQARYVVKLALLKTIFKTKLVIL